MLLLTQSRIAKEPDTVVQRYLEELLNKKTWYGTDQEDPPAPDILAQQEIETLLREVSHHVADNHRKCDVINGRVFVKKTPDPFLLFEDARLLVEHWCRSHRKPAPRPSFFSALTNAHFSLVKRFFPDAFLLTTRDYLRALNALRSTSKPVRDWPVITISLDNDFVRDTDAVIEITRVQDHRTFKPLGELARPGNPTVAEQVASIANAMPRRHTVQFHSDGCWQGREIITLASTFQKHGTTVDSVVCGVVHRDALNTFREADIPIRYSHPYLSMESWICQRDFLPGVPRSGLNLGIQTGRLVQAFQEDIGAPYILPFREDVFDELTLHDLMEFSLECYRLSDHLFAEIERLWRRPVLVSDLARVPKYMTLGRVHFRSELRRIAREFLHIDDALDPFE